jgi:hypothetical protein
MTFEDEYLHDLIKTIEISETNSLEVKFGRQTFNYFYGKIYKDNDELYILYNPFEKVRISKKILKIDKFVSDIFETLQNKYKQTPKKIEIDKDYLLERIIEYGENIDYEKLIDNVFPNGTVIRFKIHTKNRKNYAKLMFDGFDFKIKDYLK